MSNVTKPCVSSNLRNVHVTLLILGVMGHTSFCTLFEARIYHSEHAQTRHCMVRPTVLLILRRDYISLYVYSVAVLALRVTINNVLKIS